VGRKRRKKSRMGAIKQKFCVRELERSSGGDFKTNTTLIRETTPNRFKTGDENDKKESHLKKGKRMGANSRSRQNTVVNRGKDRDC